MIDLKTVREDPERVRASQRLRGDDEGVVDTLLAADDTRRAAVTRADTLRAEQKTISKQVGRATPEERPAIQAQAKELSRRVAEAVGEAGTAEQDLRTAQLSLANLVEGGGPAGGAAAFGPLEPVGPPPGYLVGTSEVALAGYHQGEILDPTQLPLRYAGFSSCFRREAGSYGKDTKGIIRVHWFDKVEMFSYVTPDDAQDEHQRLLAWEREFMDSLELAYRVIDVAAGDLGSSAARKFDIEAWFPSQQAYRELTSTSNCTTFQARRLNIPPGGAAGTTPVATLNGTLCAAARTIACLLDHHQQPDGSVYVPAALRPWLGGRELLTPR